jgi:hypothetical protein
MLITGRVRAQGFRVLDRRALVQQADPTHKAGMVQKAQPTP